MSVYAAATDLLIPATVQMPVQTAPKCGSKPIRYVTLHFRTRRVTPSFCYKIRTEITVVIGEQKPFSVWFLCWGKS